MEGKGIKVYGTKNEYIILVQKKRNGEYHKCESCGEEFYIRPCYIRKAIKMGCPIRFCSMECYDKNGDKNPFWGKTFSPEVREKRKNNPNIPKFKTGKDNPNFIRFGEAYGYKGISKNWWQRKLLREISKCELCGYPDKRALCIHHKDKNPKNNARENLIMLCWNCHAIIHFEDRSGIYNNLKTNNSERGNNNQDSI
jgi:hypothetical protein